MTQLEYEYYCYLRDKLEEAAADHVLQVYCGSKTKGYKVEFSGSRTDKGNEIFEMKVHHKVDGSANVVANTKDFLK